MQYERIVCMQVPKTVLQPYRLMGLIPVNGRVIFKSAILPEHNMFQRWGSPFIHRTDRCRQEMSVSDDMTYGGMTYDMTS